MTVEINAANEIFVNKQKSYENLIIQQKKKLKEYKFKISLLKIKINELHAEIEILQEKQCKENNNLYQNNTDDNFLNSIDKEQNSLDFIFTPEQMNLINSYNAPINNNKVNLNYNINDFIEDED